MSAIAGLWRFDGMPDAARQCGRMLTAQAIYGPHDSRLWSGGAIAMGRRLFRTLPEDTFDRGPLRSGDGCRALVADVRLDNRDELEKTLGIPGQQARRLCDAAVLYACLERWGEQALDRLVGDFALAWWDARNRTLLLARDFLGNRPLHYHRGRGFLAFASMPKGLHALPEIPYGPDEQAVTEFLALMPVDGPRSFFKDIDRVEAGQVVTVTGDGLSVRRYWEPRRQERPRRDCIEGLRHHLDQATRSRLRGANGAVAAHLSSGFDSSAVVATAARLLAPDGGRVVAFTAVPREGYDAPAPRNRIADEGPLAAATAELYPNVEHVLVRSGRDSPLDGLDRTFYLMDRPILNPCNWVWIRAIGQAARDRQLGIVLTGQMGNMTISYDAMHWLPELLRTGRWITLARTAAALLGNRQAGLRELCVQTVGPFALGRLLRRAIESVRGRTRWDVFEYTAIRPDHFARLDLASLARQRDLDFSYLPSKDGFAARLWMLRRFDQGGIYKGRLAGWGTDYRDPTADRRLVEYCLSLPMGEYLAGGIRRSLAKRALADRLPAAVLAETRKGIQAIDWHEGATAARPAVAAELERLSGCEPVSQMIDLPRLKRLVREWPTSGWERDDVALPYRCAMLRGISAGHFVRSAMRTNR